MTESKRGEEKMKEIALTQGKMAIVDDEDYGRVVAFKWHARREGRTFVAKRNVVVPGGRKSQYLHRFLLDAPDGMLVDHADGNPLNNRRGNLRICNNGENCRNRGPNPNNTSGFKGVGWDGKNHRWRAQIVFEGQNIQLGRFRSKVEAARAYDAAALKYHGRFAYYNLRPKGENA